MEVLGYYVIAAKIIEILNNFLLVIKSVTYPYLVKNQTKFKQITKILIGSGVFFTISTISLSYWVLPFIFGEMMINSLIYLYILAFSPLFLSITFSYGVNKLLVLNKDADMKKITFQYSIFGFLLALIAIPLYGAIGSAITVIVTRLLTSILVYRKVKELENEKLI
jgi:PST family polysaccharide transporter